MLPQAGLRRYGDAAAVFLERTGAISVLRRGESIAPELMRDVRGWHPYLDRYVHD